MNEIIHTNQFQTPVTKEWLEQYPDEVQEQFLDFIDTVPLIKWMIGDRPRAKDLPRDDEGKIIVDITHPHILEDMDYFRPAAKFYEQNGCYSLLKPNANPNSEYGKWFAEEVRRCREGYVRESDGEWITGQMYFFMNYCRIMLTRKSNNSSVAKRVEDFPDFWEGIYYRFHYIDQARKAGKHCVELARRGCGKSFVLASIMTHNLLLGENEEVKRRVTTVLTAYLKEYLAEKDGTLSKFTPMVDFCAANTEFPRLMVKRSQAEMIWTMGYKNKNGNIKGSLNSVLGLSVKDDEGKVRGKRGFIFFEEIGSYANFRGVWDNVRDSVKDGEEVFSLLYGVGTAGDKESDFSGVKTILYNPDSYEVLALDNVYDRKGKGTDKFAYFFPSYMSRTGCMDENGNSDVTKALMSILMMRYQVKQGGDAASYLSRVAQMPITPAEAILKVKSSYFPVTMLTERARQLDINPHIYDDVYVGTLVDVGGKVEFKATDDRPIRKWPVDNTEEGALEVYTMPPPGGARNRFIIGCDPINQDMANSNSLFSFFVFDLVSDDIAAEYTGRKRLAEDAFELVRLAAIFWNATIMYESNSKMMFAYFAKLRCTWMLADCPEYLRARGVVKYNMFGSSAKGISSSAGTIMTGNEQIRDWLLKTYPVEVKDEQGELHIEQVPQLYRLRCRALIDELIGYGPEVNTDRVSALQQTMMYREQFVILYGGSPDGADGSSDASDDEFFDRDWQRLKDRLGPLYKSAFEQ